MEMVCISVVSFDFVYCVIDAAKKEEPKKEKKIPQAAAKALRKKKKRGVSAVVKIPTGNLLFLICY